MPVLPMPPLMQNAVEPMQVDAPPNEDNENNEEQQIVVENPTIDLEVYANQYTGIARLDRLIYVADVCPLLALESLKMAITYVQSTYNVKVYQMLHKRLSDLQAVNGAGATAAAAGAEQAVANAAAAAAAVAALPDIAAQPAAAAQAQANAGAAAAGAGSGAEKDAFAYDAVWVDAKMKKAALKLEKLDSDLKNYKSNSIKESIRRGHDDLADHYLSCGDLTNALKCYSRARDYCTSGKHVVNMCLNVIKVSIYLKNWAHVMSYISKAESTPDFSEGTKEANAQVHTRLECAAGLAELQQKKYKVAAKHFLAANFDHCDFPEMISPSNVAVYGGLCALATFDRPELKRLVIASTSFKLFLELEPQLRDIIFKFYESNYASCLTLLDEIRDNLLVDMYIAPHVNTLYTKIRNRALIQYFSPYMSADMHKMATAFNSTIGDLENEVMQLILDGQIQARIDSHNRILYAKEADQRNSTFERALLMGKQYQRHTRMLILRAAMLKSHIHVKSISRDGGSSNHGAELCVSAGSSTTAAQLARI
ncbi:COP9 signalosome complex subunit 1b [Drosophila grimshawi]|uniref:GH16963 n=1 Tax=Drosophila grimshawi TaxID=7222 RepID=B4IYD3_DROGR|nr:COP9 signalosome complex subunit 1b [Drosophila grimshawi]EDV97606.1 GH16963 [Drosophila grimshawi]